MQAPRRHLVELAKPGNVDRRKAFMDIMERLALGVITVAVPQPSRSTAAVHAAARPAPLKGRTRRS